SKCFPKTLTFRRKNDFFHSCTLFPFSSVWAKKKEFQGRSTLIFVQNQCASALKTLCEPPLGGEPVKEEKKRVGVK
ncbi:MAG: hypothetical protein AAF599_09875, partial [Bacteroidota bacterium]